MATQVAVPPFGSGPAAATRAAHRSWFAALASTTAFRGAAPGGSKNTVTK
jgi:hypothetical protein